MTKYKCECGMQYKSQQGLHYHGNKSKKSINDGKGCIIYQQRKKDGMPLNIAKIAKSDNNESTITEIDEKNNNTIKNLKKKIKDMEDTQKKPTDLQNETNNKSDNTEKDKTINDLQRKIKVLEEEQLIKKKMSHLQNETDNEKDKIIRDLQNKIEKMNKEKTIVNGNNNTINNINIHINNATEESIEPFLLNLNATIQKTIYNNFKVFIPGQGETKDYNSPQLSNYKGHLYLADALYNDKNYPENKTHFYDRSKNKLFVRKDNKWVSQTAEIHVIDIRKNIYNKIGPVLYPHRFEDQVEDIHQFTRDNFQNAFNNREQTLLIDIMDLYKKDKPIVDESDDNYDSYTLNKWTEINNDYLNWIRQ